MSGLAPSRVLVVDDDPLLRRLFARALERLGVDAVVVATSAEAAAASRQTPFTLAFVDYKLQGELGEEVAERISVSQNPPPIIVCISGAFLPQGNVTPRGFDGTDRKPATTEEMEALLARWRGWRREAP